MRNFKLCFHFFLFILLCSFVNLFFFVRRTKYIKIENRHCIKFRNEIVYKTSAKSLDGIKRAYHKQMLPECFIRMHSRNETNSQLTWFNHEIFYLRQNLNGVDCLSWINSRMPPNTHTTAHKAHSAPATFLAWRNKQMIAIQPSVICFHNAVLFGIDCEICISYVCIGHGCEHIAHLVVLY